MSAWGLGREEGQLDGLLLVLAFPGPRTSTPFPSGGAEATAAAGGQGSGSLWLRLEGSAHE